MQEKFNHCECGSHDAKGRIFRKSSGFTLIEILVVIAIISMVLVVGLPAVQQITSYQLNTTTRKFSGLMKAVRDRAVFRNKIHRIVIRYEDNSYWVESQRQTELVGAEPPPRSKKGEEAPPSPYEAVAQFTKEPVPLPDGVEFSGVYSDREGLITEGIAYIFFFPNGYNEGTKLFLRKTGSENTGYSLTLNPVTGKTEIASESVEEYRQRK